MNKHIKINDLEEQRAKLLEEARAACDLDDGEKFAKIEEEIDEITTRIYRAAKIDELDRRAQGRAITGSEDENLDQELRQFSIVKAIAGAAGLSVDWGRERELQAELAKRAGRPAKGILIPTQVFEKRVLTTGLPVAGPGSNIIATDHRGDQFIDILRNRLAINMLGATVLNGLTGNVDIPRLKASGSTGWVAENAALTAADNQFDKVAMTPKHAGALTELSRNMLQQSSPDIEDLVRRDFAALLAEAIDTVAINGGGTNEPTGVLATTGIPTVALGTNGAAMTVDTATDLIAKIDDANGPAARRGFLSNTKVKAAALKLKDSNLRPYGLAEVFKNERVEFSNAVPADLAKGTGSNLSAILYGDWSELIIGYWSAFDLLVNPYESTAFKKGNVQIRAMMTADIALRHVESFAVVKDAIAS